MKQVCAWGNTQFRSGDLHRIYKTTFESVLSNSNLISMTLTTSCRTDHTWTCGASSQCWQLRLSVTYRESFTFLVVSEKIGTGKSLETGIGKIWGTVTLCYLYQNIILTRWHTCDFVLPGQWSVSLAVLCGLVFHFADLQIFQPEEDIYYVAG